MFKTKHCMCVVVFRWMAKRNTIKGPYRPLSEDLRWKLSKPPRLSAPNNCPVNSRRWRQHSPDLERLLFNHSSQEPLLRSAQSVPNLAPLQTAGSRYLVDICHSIIRETTKWQKQTRNDKGKRSCGRNREVLASASNREQQGGRHQHPRVSRGGGGSVHHFQCPDNQDRWGEGGMKRKGTAWRGHHHQGAGHQGRSPHSNWSSWRPSPRPSSFPSSPSCGWRPVDSPPPRQRKRARQFRPQ